MLWKCKLIIPHNEFPLWQCIIRALATVSLVRFQPDHFWATLYHFVSNMAQKWSWNLTKLTVAKALIIHCHNDVNDSDINRTTSCYAGLQHCTVQQAHSIFIYRPSALCIWQWFIISGLRASKVKSFLRNLIASSFQDEYLLVKFVTYTI